MEQFLLISLQLTISLTPKSVSLSKSCSWCSRPWSACVDTELSLTADLQSWTPVLVLGLLYFEGGYILFVWWDSAVFSAKKALGLLFSNFKWELWWKSRLSVSYLVSFVVNMAQVVSYASVLRAIGLKLYSKTRVKRPLSKRPKIGFQDQLSLNAGQKYCRMLQREHSAIVSTFFVIEIFYFFYFTPVLLYITG